MAQLGLRKWGTQFDTIDKEKARREVLRKEKLTALLNQKIHRAFGLTSSHPIIENEIESFVLNNKEDFSDQKLQSLKLDIAQKLAPEGISLQKRKGSRVGGTAAKAGLGIVGITETPTLESKRLTKGGKNASSMNTITPVNPKARSIRGSQASHRSTTSFRSLAESDEWREIQNFNTLLHLEEQNQEIQKEKDRQRMIKEQLDQQIREKKERERKEKETERMYEEMQKKIMNEADRKERLRLENMRRKIQKDKESRDRQIIMEGLTRKGEQDREKAQEALMVNKLKKELELEKLALREQKKERKDQMKNMFAENTNAQYLSKIAAEKEREEDERMQREIKKKLEEQQNREAKEAAKRREKHQNFVEKMNTDVFSKIQQRNKEEEEKIKKYSEEKNMKDRFEEERRLKKIKREQHDMRETLARQMKDKKSKEEIDKEIIEEQAALWRMDREQFEKAERELNQKMKTLSDQNAQLLQQQMEEHKNKNKGMDPIEYQLNKTYLKGIRAKKHEIIKETV